MFKKTAAKLALCPASLALAATVALGGSTPGFADDEVTSGPAAALVTVQNNPSDADAGAIEALNLVIERQAAEITDSEVPDVTTPDVTIPDVTDPDSIPVAPAHRPAHAGVPGKPAHAGVPGKPAHAHKQKPAKPAAKTKPAKPAKKAKPAPQAADDSASLTTQSTGTPKFNPGHHPSKKTGAHPSKHKGNHPAKHKGNHPAKHKGNHPSKNGWRNSR